MNDQEALVHAYQSGRLLEAIQAELSTDPSKRTGLASDLVALHNQGLVDLIEAFSTITGKSAPGRDHFLLCQVLEKALPELEAPVPKVTRCVQHLYLEAGADMILDAFRDFCTKQEDRPRAALAEIEANPDALADLLIPVLIAGSTVDASTYAAETLRLARHANAAIRRRALAALGMLEAGKVVWYNEDVIKTLEHAVEVEEDDAVLASTIGSAFVLYRQDAARKSRLAAVIASALAKGGELSLQTASRIFGFQTRDLSSELLELFLEYLAHVRPDERSVDSMDYGIAHLLTGDHVEAGLRFLEKLLRSYPEEIELANFDDTARAISDNPSLRSKVVSRWLLGGEAALCSGLASIVDARIGGSPDIEADITELINVGPFRLLFAARKAIGYLFLQPTSAASFLLSLMRHSPDAKVRRDIEDLLLNPLLLNFTSLADYLTRRAESEEGEVKAALGRALEALESYLEKVNSVGDIPALHPSLSHREAYHRYRAEQYSEASKKAESESVLLHLFPKTVLLYGRKAIYHSFGPAGDIARMETQLGTHRAEVAIARMTIIDPLGLEFMLRVFQHERISA